MLCVIIGIGNRGKGVPEFDMKLFYLKAGGGHGGEVAHTHSTIVRPERKE